MKKVLYLFLTLVNKKFVRSFVLSSLSLSLSLSLSPLSPLSLSLSSLSLSLSLKTIQYDRIKLYDSALS